jgi:hypothetical protein
VSTPCSQQNRETRAAIRRMVALEFLWGDHALARDLGQDQLAADEVGIGEKHA